MSVAIQPAELSFRRPFTQEVSQVLAIRNLGSSPIAFKVKTTAPKQYCVRPNSGRIEAGQDVEVSVLLQAMKQEPPLETRCKDKFLVQSAVIPIDRDSATIPAIFESAQDKASITEKKIRVNWLPASGGLPPGPGGAPDAISPIKTATPNRQSLINGGDTPEVSKVYSSPGDGTSTDHPTTAPPAYESETNDSKDALTPVEDKSPSVSASTAAVPATVRMTYEELRARLEETEARLAAALKEGTSGLRQRGFKSADDKGAAPQAVAARQQGPEGVSVQIVAVLCFLSFLLAYFFF